MADPEAYPGGAGGFPQYGAVPEGAAHDADHVGHHGYHDKASDGLHAVGNAMLWAGGGLASPFLPSGKPLFLRARRRRLSVLPVALSVIVPFILFAIIFAVMSFSIRFKQPLLCFFIVGCGLVCVLIVGCGAAKAKRGEAQHEPNWLTFIFLTSLLAWVLAVVGGEANYSATNRKFNTVKSLSTYHGVDPARMRGQQLMDAGIIQFSNNSRLDVTKSMGFRTGEMYCVAPVTSSDQPLPQYDFWLVGKDCCTASSGSFRCEGYGNTHIAGGLRLTSDDERPYYRLAVQHAEAKFGIKAVHPLFFTWTRDPDAAVEEFGKNNGRWFIIGLCTFFVFHTFVTVVAAIAFSRIGHY